MSSTFTADFSSSASPPTSTSTGGTDPNLNLNASPPLILAVLCVSLFGCAMIGVLGWRRVQYNRGLLPTMRTTNGQYIFPAARGSGVAMWRELGPGARNEKGHRIGEKPKFWDLKTILVGRNFKAGDDGEESELEGWQGIMPISVTIRKDEQGSLPDAAGGCSNVNNANFDPLAGYYALHDGPILDNYFRRPAGKPIVVVPNSETSAQSECRMDRIQVAVTIAMPSPFSCHIDEKPRGSATSDGNSEVTNNDRDDSDDWMRPVVYTLGLYERPWKREEG